MKIKKPYLTQYYEMTLKLNFDGEEEGVNLATSKEYAKLEALKQKAIQQSGLTDAEVAFICINRLQQTI